MGGEEFEKQHFDGDFLGNVKKAPLAATVHAVSSFTEDVEREHFQGDFVGTLAGALPSSGEPSPTCPTYSTGGTASSTASVRSCSRDGTPMLPRMDKISSGAGLWEESERLRLELELEKDMRRGRGGALNSLNEKLCELRGKHAAERSGLADAQNKQSTALLDRDVATARLEQLKVRHNGMTAKRGANEAEIRSLIAAEQDYNAAQAAQSEVSAEWSDGLQMWARPGPEMEALREAKDQLSEVIALLGEARRQSAEELWQLQEQMEQLVLELDRMRRGAGDGTGKTAAALMKAVTRLFAVAGGRDDPYAAVRSNV